jgi:glycogen operon protein
MLATLLLSQGTPMLLAGDEFGRTQKGNNNAYCQDNEISWLDWNLGDDAKDLLSFTKRLVELRRAFPTLRKTRFLTGQRDEELDVCDVMWINANGGPMQEEHWKDPTMMCFGMYLDGRAQKTGIRRHGEDETVLIVVNSFDGLVDFTLPEAPHGSKWALLTDTNIPDGAPGAEFACGSMYQVTARSLLLFSLGK